MQLHEEILKTIVEHDTSHNSKLITGIEITQKLNITNRDTFFECIDYLSSQNFIKVHSSLQSGLNTCYQSTPLGRSQNIYKLQQKLKDKKEFWNKFKLSVVSQLAQKAFAFIAGYLFSVATYEWLKAQAAYLMQKIIYLLSS